MKVKSIIRVVLPRYVIIVHQYQSPDWQYEHIGVTGMQTLAHLNQELPMEQLAKKIAAIRGVASVEIVGWDNNGIRIENE
jgi:hypothetical protein